MICSLSIGKTWECRPLSAARDFRSCRSESATGFLLRKVCLLRPQIISNDGWPGRCLERLGDAVTSGCHRAPPSRSSVNPPIGWELSPCAPHLTSSSVNNPGNLRLGPIEIQQVPTVIIRKRDELDLQGAVDSPKPPHQRGPGSPFRSTPLLVLLVAGPPAG